MLNVKKFKGAFSKYRDPQKKFDLVTGDYIQGREDSILAITGDRNAFVIKDLWSGIKQIYPSADRDADTTVIAIMDFLDTTPCKRFYSDDDRAIKDACKKCKVRHETSMPGIHETNAKIENAILDIERGARSALIQAGFPPCFWSFAAPHYCLLDNTETLDPKGEPYPNGSRYFQFHGEEFPGLRAPFGCEVIFKQAPTKAKEFQPVKFEGDWFHWNPCWLPFPARVQVAWCVSCLVIGRASRRRSVGRREVIP
jgi:Integrase core domain.